MFRLKKLVIFCITNYTKISFILFILFKVFVNMGGEESKSFIYNEPITQNKEPGFSHIYRNQKFKKELTMTPDTSFRTYRDVFLRSCL